MKLKVLAGLAAFTLGASVLLSGNNVMAEDKPAAKPAAKAPAKLGAPGVISKKVGIAPKGLRFGLGLEGLAGLYDRVFDDEFLPLYKKAQPGTEMDALDEELKQKKAFLRRSRVEFGQTPTGVDYSPLKGEYSYANGESMGHITLRSGTERYFFFFADKLWKVYDEHKLTKGGTLGENFDEALKILGTRFGAPPKRIASNFEAGQNFDEGLWADPEKYIRAVDRGNVLGMVYIDKNIQDNLAQHRKNKPANLHAMDSDVTSALKKPDAPPPPIVDAANPKKAGKKK
ncbi:MAG TPA: hypothetical protein VM686_22185 [Polyangiaceae bacterium]|nr:hypothetical protein [Polyangiaceae bacterium]